MSELVELGLEPAQARPPRRRGGIAVVLAAMLLAAALVAGIVFVKGQLGKKTITDYPGPGTGAIAVTIESGSTLSDIGRLLASKGVVATTSAFVDAANKEPKAKTIAPGTYELRNQMRAADAVQFLIGNAHRLTLHVVVPEGFEADQVLKAIAATGKIDMASLQAASRDAAALKLPPYANGHVEGFLFPRTYNFDAGTTAAAALAQMVAGFKDEAKAIHLEAGAAAEKLSPYDVLIIASIIEREAKNQDEYGKVARVILNRLAKDMPLQMDSTLQYTRDVRKVRLSLKDIADVTPYNTYTHKGLPPTPIANPGEASLQAALNPEPGNWLYFVSFPNGKTKFTNDYNEFVKLKNQAGLNSPAK